MARRSGSCEHAAAGHNVSAVRRPRDKDADACLPLRAANTLVGGMVPSISRVGLPTLNNPA